MVAHLDDGSDASIESQGMAKMSRELDIEGNNEADKPVAEDEGPA